MNCVGGHFSSQLMDLGRGGPCSLWKLLQMSGLLKVKYSKTSWQYLVLGTGVGNSFSALMVLWFQIVHWMQFGWFSRSWLRTLLRYIVFVPVLAFWHLAVVSVFYPVKDSRKL